MELTVIMPCRNEEESLADCIKQVQDTINDNHIDGEIIVSDSSVDRSPEIAKEFGVKLVKHDQVGYGRAYLEGIKEASGKYIFMADADGTYDFKEIARFLKSLREGHDLVIGNRLKGKIAPKAMPFLHRYWGNPWLSGLARIFFKTKISDIHCGMRAISRQALDKIALKTTGMEFASEMVIRAGIEKLKIAELPINYYQRKGKSKLRSLSDGWRHLRFMLMYAPDYLFLVPGFLFAFGGLVMAWLFKGSVVYGCFLFLLGYQTFSLGIFTKVYMRSVKLIKFDPMVDWLARIVKFETGVFIGVGLLLIVFILSQPAIFEGMTTALDLASYNLIIIALTIAIIGIQTMFSAFLISILLVEKK